MWIHEGKLDFLPSQVNMRTHMRIHMPKIHMPKIHMPKIRAHVKSMEKSTLQRDVKTSSKKYALGGGN
jgi:hypothetical protein